MVNPRPFSLYLHIPFCARKCDYCHFYVVPNHPSYQSLLLEGLQTEWVAYSKNLKGTSPCSIYFGGGTPSLFGPGNVADLLSLIPNQECEITLEANPEHLTKNLMQGYLEAGINRISIGVQSFDDALLTLLTRQHNAKKAIEAIEATYQAGIKNISIDLMYDLPGQSLENWRKSLLKAVSLPITHLSLYNLTIEPHTTFFKQREKLKSKIPSSDVSAAMYQTAIEILHTHGFVQYEISAFCKPSCHSLHNTGYWTNRDFIGLGPSAFSYWEGKRFRNIPRLHRWHDALTKGASPIDYSEILSPEARERENLALRLRLLEGVLLKEFQLDNPTLHAIDTLKEDGLLEFCSQKEILKLTNKGTLFYDTVAAEII